MSCGICSVQVPYPPGTPGRRRRGTRAASEPPTGPVSRGEGRLHLRALGCFAFGGKSVQGPRFEARHKAPSGRYVGFDSASTYIQVLSGCCGFAPCTCKGSRPVLQAARQGARSFVAKLAIMAGQPERERCIGDGVEGRIRLSLALLERPIFADSTLRDPSRDEVLRLSWVGSGAHRLPQRARARHRCADGDTSHGLVLPSHGRGLGLCRGRGRQGRSSVVPDAASGSTGGRS